MSRRRRTRPWWLAVGIGFAAGTVAGLSPHPVPVLLAAVGAGLIALRGRPAFAAASTGPAAAVTALLLLDPTLDPWMRLGGAVAYGIITAGIVALARHHGTGVWLVSAALAAATLVTAPRVVLEPTTEAVVTIEAERATLNLEATEQYLAREVRDGRLPGLVFGAAEHGKPIRYLAFGPAGPEHTQVRHTTRFRIGSMSKSFTALAVLRLAEDGKIDIDRPVADYLDWFKVNYPAGRNAPITVADLLRHDSGIPNSAGWQHLAGGGEDPLTDMTQELADTTLLPPGEVEYANANFVLAAQIVEQVTGQTYADYLTNHILEPLDLDATTARRPTGDDLATGYQLWFGMPVRSTAPFLDFAVPAGFITSNAPDLLTYVDHVVRSDNPIITPRIRQTLLDGTVAAPTSSVGEPFAGQRYGMGWVRGPIADVEVLWHSGGLADFNSVMVSHPDGDWAFMILINTASQVSALMPTITENVTSILTGGDQRRTTAGQTLTNTYLLVNLAVVLAGVVLAWGTATLAKQRGEPQRRNATLITGVGSTVVLGGLLFFIPSLTGFPASPLSPQDQISLFRVLTTYVPDVGWTLTVAAVACAALALASLALAFTHRTTSSARSRPDPIL